MDELVERVIKRLNEKNKCGRYSDATVESTIREVITDKELSELAKRFGNAKKVGDKIRENKEEDKTPYTFRDILKESDFNPDEIYDEVLIIAQKGEDVFTNHSVNDQDVTEVLNFYYFVKENLKGIVVNKIPDRIVEMYGKVREIYKD